MNDKSRFAVSCHHCSLSALCIPHSLTSEEMDTVDAEIKRAKPLKKIAKFLVRAKNSNHSMLSVQVHSKLIALMNLVKNTLWVSFYLGRLLG